MEEVYQSVRIINILRDRYPGKWTNSGDIWNGEHFKVVRRDGKFFRLDTGEEIEMPKRKKRSHFIHNILADMFGGTWRKNTPYSVIWRSKDHDFLVYRSGEWLKEKQATRQVYRRSDTGEVIYRSNGRRF